MSGRVLLKGIYMSMYDTEKKTTSILTIETSFDQSVNFWDDIEKIAIFSQNQNEYACWNCGLLYLTKSWGIPIFTFTDIKNEYQKEYRLHHNLPGSLTRSEFSNLKTYGHFCSIVCAVRFLEESLDIPRNIKDKYRNLLYFAYSQYCGHKVCHIPPAYSKTRMRIYCGPEGWSEQEYREKNKALEAEIIVEKWNISELRNKK